MSNLLIFPFCHISLFKFCQGCVRILFCLFCLFYYSNHFVGSLIQKPIFYYFQSYFCLVLLSFLFNADSRDMTCAHSLGLILKVNHKTLGRWSKHLKEIRTVWDYLDPESCGTGASKTQRKPLKARFTFHDNESKSVAQRCFRNDKGKIKCVNIIVKSSTIGKATNLCSIVLFALGMFWRLEWRRHFVLLPKHFIFCYPFWALFVFFRTPRSESIATTRKYEHGR